MAVEQVEPVVVAVLQQSIEFALCYLEKSVGNSDDLSLQVSISFEHSVSCPFLLLLALFNLLFRLMTDCCPTLVGRFCYVLSILIFNYISKLPTRILCKRSGIMIIFCRRDSPNTMNYDCFSE